MPSTEQHALSKIVPIPTCFRLNWQDLLCCLLTPFPTGHRTSSVLGLQDLREEIRRVWEAPSPVPTAKWGVGSPVPPPLSYQMAQGPVGKHRCSLLPLTLLCSPGYTSHNTCTTSAWGGHSLILGTSPRTHDPQAELSEPSYLQRCI